MSKTSKLTKWCKQLAEYQGFQFRSRPKWHSENRLVTCNTVYKTSNSLNKAINPWSSNRTRTSKNYSKFSMRPNKAFYFAKKFNWFPKPCANLSTLLIFWSWPFKNKFDNKNLRKLPTLTRYVKKSTISWLCYSKRSRITINLDTNEIIKKVKSILNHSIDRSLIIYIKFVKTWFWTSKWQHTYRSTSKPNIEKKSKNLELLQSRLKHGCCRNFKLILNMF